MSDRSMIRKNKREQAWPADLVSVALSDFALTDSVDHGIAHWARVRANGVRLALRYGVNPAIPALFGLLHDCRRENEHYDPDHGPRAALLVEELASQDRLRLLNPQEVSYLVRACAEHSEGFIDAPKAVQVCWDADRLDLGRVGVRPDPARLCTDAARDQVMLAQAYRWSCGYAWSSPVDELDLMPEYYSPSRRILG